MKSAPRRFRYVKLGEDRRSLEVSLANRLIYEWKDPVSATTRDWFNTTVYVVATAGGAVDRDDARLPTCGCEVRLLSVARIPHRASAAQ